MSLGTSSAQFMFKVLYEDGVDVKVLVRNKPLMQWAANKTNFTSSRGMEIPAPYVNPQGIGATNSGAAANEVSSKGVTFLMPQRNHVGFGKIDGIVVRNAMNGDDESQFIDAMEREVDGVTESIGSDLHRSMYGDKSGLRCLTSATTSLASTTWTLANEEDAQVIEPGMKIVLVNPATGLARAGTAVTVVSVDGTSIVTSGNMNTFTSAAVGDGIARDTMVGVDFDGLAGWVPSTRPTAGDSFNGVDRSIYPNRLAGVYVSIANDPVRSGFIKAKSKAKSQVGTMFDSSAPFFINPKNLAQIAMSVEQTKVTDIKLADSYEIGIDAVKIMGHTFVEDSMCPVNTAYLVGDGAWVRYSCGKQPKLDDQDGNEFFFDRSSGSTGVLSFVMVHDGNCGSPKPYNILRCALPTATL